jgi:hypothetical protein
LAGDSVLFLKDNHPLTGHFGAEKTRSFARLLCENLRSFAKKLQNPGFFQGCLPGCAKLDWLMLA